LERSEDARVKHLSGDSQGRSGGRTRDGACAGCEEGRLTEARRLLAWLGQKYLSEPDAATLAKIEALADLDRLETLYKRALEPDVQSWNDLLGES
jgi:hypothetical protein